MQEVEAICDRVIILRQGKLALDSMLVNLKQDNYINITLDQPLDKLESLCKDFKDITKIEVSKQEGKYYSYKIYTPHNSIEEIIPNLARQICTKQWKLYNMNSEQQTLETIFNEVNKNHLGDSRHV